MPAAETKIRQDLSLVNGQKTLTDLSSTKTESATITSSR